MFQDFLDFLDVLLEAKVEFVIVGAHAMGAWGYVRATGDLDVFVNATEENAKRVLKALKKFGAPLDGVTLEDFSSQGSTLQVGVAPIRIDVLTQIDSVSFSNAAKNAAIVPLGGRKVPVLSLEDLIKNKGATGRKRDKVDAEELKKLRKK